MSLDPFRAEDGVSMKILGNTMLGLVGYDSSGKLVPRLARSWSVSPDRLRYEFLIRKDARWSDGKPVEASDFARSLERASGPGNLSKLAPMFSAIRAVQARGDRLVVTLREPISYFPQLMALTLALPSRGAWSEAAPVTGPYRIVEHVPESKIVLERNPYALNPPKIPRVNIKVVTDESTALHLFEEGKLDIVGKIPDAEFARMRQAGKVRTDPYVAVYYLAFNLKKAPFDRVEYRRAVAASIHKREILSLFQTGEILGTSWIPKGLEGYETDLTGPSLAPSEIARAKAALSRAKPVALSYDSSSRNRLVVEKVQQDLAQALGLNLLLENMDWKSYIRQLQTDAAPIYRFAWLAPLADPIVHLRVFETGNPNNYSHYSNPRYDQLVERISRTEPGAERDKLLRDAQKILIVDDAVVIPLYHYVQNHLVSPRVRNFSVNPFGIIPFDELWLDQDKP